MLPLARGLHLRVRCTLMRPLLAAARPSLHHLSHRSSPSLPPPALPPRLGRFYSSSPDPPIVLSPEQEQELEAAMNELSQEAGALARLVRLGSDAVREEEALVPGVVMRDLVLYDAALSRYLSRLVGAGLTSQALKAFETFAPLHPPQGGAQKEYIRALLLSPSHLTRVMPALMQLLAPASVPPVAPPGGSKLTPLWVAVQGSRASTILSVLGLVVSLAFLGVLTWSLRSGGDKGGVGSLLHKAWSPSTPDTTISFEDVIGNSEAKEELQDLVAYLRAPERFEGIKVPKGVLLVGPPGTGKTLLARALAGEAGVPFLTASGSEFEEVFVGLGARRIRQLFEEARQQAPCIIFIDEIDALGGKREASFRNQQMSLNQLLVELDGFDSREGIIVIGATNMATHLDPALVRPGRFDRNVQLELPEQRDRQAILEHYLRPFPLAPDVDTLVLARETAGLSGAELEGLVNWAALERVKGNHAQLDDHLLNQALWNVAMGREKRSMVLSDRVRRTTAYHEGGHALVALHLDHAPEIRKATLVPRGGALGMVNYLPSEEKLTTKAELLARMRMAMGGRAAEELIFGADQVTTGASSDFEAATQIAHAMVTRYGMSDKVGHVHVDEERQGRLVDEEVKLLVEAAYRDALSSLTTHEAELHRLALALLQYETLDRAEITAIIQGRTLPDRDQKDAKRKETQVLRAQTKPQPPAPLEGELGAAARRRLAEQVGPPRLALDLFA